MYSKIHVSGKKDWYPKYVKKSYKLIFKKKSKTKNLSLNRHFTNRINEWLIRK